MTRSRIHFRTAARAALLTFALAVTTGIASSQSLEPPRYQAARAHDFDFQHYRLVLSFDWAKHSVAGQTAITMKPLKSSLKEVEIDASNMKINSVSLNQGRPLRFRYDGGEKLFVTLDRQYPVGSEITITIDYSAAPKYGLAFVGPTEADPNRPRQIWTIGQPEYNHYWFPCYDYPNDKATSEVIATIEDKYQVISNGRLVSVKLDASAKTKTWHWKMDKPHASYLISLIVGEFEEIKDRYKGVQIISYVYRDRVEEAKVTFANTAKMMKFFSEKIGYDYPYNRYTQATVHDSLEGMENVTATVLNDMALVDRRALLDTSADWLIAHELAHSWFGNLITCNDWGNIWLHEGFANFFDALWTEHAESKDAYLYKVYGEYGKYFGAWDQGNRRPLTDNRFNSLYELDAYPYARGIAVLNMLRFVLGEGPFWKSINHYVKKHQWQNVQAQDFAAAIKEATGQDLQWFFDEWVYKVGHPEFEITSNYDGSKTLNLKIKQTQQPDKTRPWYQSPAFFVMPVDIAITTASGEQVHRVLVDKAEKEFTFAVDSKPLIINFDKGDFILKRVNFKRSIEELSYQLLHDSDAMGRLRAANALAASGSETAVKPLAEAVLRDQFWGVRAEALRALAAFKTDESRAAMVEALNDKEARVRRASLWGLVQFRDPKLADRFIKVINSDPSYFNIAVAALALGNTNAPEAYDALMRTLKQDSWQDIVRAGVLEGLVALRKPESLDLGLKYAGPSYPPILRIAAFHLISEMGKGDQRVMKSLTSALKERFWQIRQGALQGLAVIADPRSLPALEELAGVADLTNSTRSLLENLTTQLKKQDKPEGSNR
ncbi:MAG: M1 family aminopeptidase [Blastocatellia bacterium]